MESTRLSVPNLHDLSKTRHQVMRNFALLVWNRRIQPSHVESRRVPVRRSAASVERKRVSQIAARVPGVALDYACLSSLQKLSQDANLFRSSNPMKTNPADNKTAFTQNITYAGKSTHLGL